MTDLGWDLEYFSDTAGPAAPVALPATQVTGASFRANWQASARAQRYLLDVARDSLFTDFLFRDRVVDGLTLLVTDDVEQAVNYFYRVRGLNMFGAGAPSNTIALFTDSIDAPVAIAATDIQDTTFRANWNVVAEADHYELDVSATADFAELVPVDAIVSTEDLFKAIANLVSETDYFYRVRAVKANGVTSLNSNVVTLTTEASFVGSGGDEVIYFDDLNETVHIFDNSGDFEVLQGSRAVRRLIVAGGGMGGGVNGSGVACGGGGGGGVLDLDETDRPVELDVDVYPVVVGDGGSVPGLNNIGENGDDSSFAGDTAIGGGYGGGAAGTVGDGGSGGGARNSAGSELGGVGTPGQGTDGGDCPSGTGGGGGGGGGAAEAGENGDITQGGDGGDGIGSDITGEVELYGAGGGGGRPVDPFGPIAGTAAGVGGAGGGGNGANTNGAGGPGEGSPGTGVGAGGGGSLGNNKGGAGKKGRVAIRYVGRGEGSEIIPPDEPPEYVGPITFDGCTREQSVEGIDILVDCNARIDSGIFPDYQRYLCPGGGVVQSSRSMRANSLPSQLPDDPLPGGEHGIQNGTLVFRFSVPIKAFKITRKVTSGTDAAPFLIACDDYTVVPHPTSAIPGSSKDGAIVNNYRQTPQVVSYPTIHLEPAVNLAAEEVQEIIYEPGFTCVVIAQSTKFPSEFVDPMFSPL